MRIFFPFHSRCTTPTGAPFPFIFQSVPPFSSPWPANNKKAHSFFQQRLPLHFPSHKPLLPFSQVFPSVSSSLSASPAFPQAFLLPLDNRAPTHPSPSHSSRPPHPKTSPFTLPYRRQFRPPSQTEPGLLSVFFLSAPVSSSVAEAIASNPSPVEQPPATATIRQPPHRQLAAPFLPGHGSTIGQQHRSCPATDPPSASSAARSRGEGDEIHETEKR